MTLTRKVKGLMLVAAFVVAGLGGLLGAAPASAMSNSVTDWQFHALPDGSEDTLYAYVKSGETLNYSNFLLHRFFNQGGTTGVAQVSLTILDPSGTQVASCITAPGDITLANLNLTCTSTPTSPSITATTTGVYKIIPKVVGTNAANVRWATFDLTLSILSGSTVQTGRIWTDYLSTTSVNGSLDNGGTGTTWDVNGYDLTLYYVTTDGFIYKTTYNTINGIHSGYNASKFGVYNQSAKCQTLYASADNTIFDPVTGQEHSAGFGMPTDCGTPYHIFLEQPATDLPATAASADGEIFVLPPVQPTIISSPQFAKTTGAKGTLTFDISNYNGPINVQIDTNNDGIFERTVAATQTGCDAANKCSYSYQLDGQDAAGKDLTLPAQVKFKVSIAGIGQIHLIMNDVELLDGGLSVTRLNGPTANNTILYWDDTKLSTTVKACPATPRLDGTAGVDSSAGVHGWTVTEACQDAFRAARTTVPPTMGSNDNSWGDGRYIDNWAFAARAADAAAGVADADGNILLQELLVNFDQPAVPETPNTSATGGLIGSAVANTPLLALVAFGAVAFVGRQFVRARR